jgi:hypothetical protein
VPKTIQIRDIDDEVYMALARRAAEARVTVPDQDHAAPHVVDIEVLNVVRGHEMGRHEMEGRLGTTAATQAIEDLHA